MPKVIVSDKKGLNQVAGSGLDLKFGNLTWSRRVLTQDVVLANAATDTPFPGIVLPQWSRVVSWKLEIVKAGGAAGTITKVGTVGDDDMLHAGVAGTMDDLRQLDSVSGFPLAAGVPAQGISEANAAQRVFSIDHGNPGVAGPTVRATVIVETVS